MATSAAYITQVAIEERKVGAASCGPTTNFITTWKTDNPGTSNSTSINIPGGFGNNYQVDWNNDGVMDETVTTNSKAHDFGVAGTYTIQICGTFPQIRFANNDDRQKILRIDQWGDNQWTSFNGAFYGASNLDVTATDTPDLSGVTDMNGMFLFATSLVGNASFGNWDTGNIINMGSMFRGAVLFNQPIGSWDTGSVTSMASLFNDADAFDQDLGEWDVSNASSMSDMFYSSGLSASKFDQTMSGWSTQNLEQGVLLTGPGYFCTSGDEIQYIIDTYSWTITGWSANCDLSLNGLVEITTAPNPPMNSSVGTITATNFIPRVSDPYLMTCDTPGQDDEFFTMGGASGDQLLLTSTLESSTPLDHDGNSKYEVCVKSTNAFGKSISQTFYINVPLEKIITGVTFTQEDDKKLIVVQGVAFFEDENGYGEGFTRSLVSLNGEPLAICVQGSGYTVNDFVTAGINPAYYTEDQPCYFLLEGGLPSIGVTSARIWLPDNFDVDTEGTVSVNGSDVFTFNETEDIQPTVDTGGDKPITDNPTIPKRPVFSGVASPGATVVVTVHSDPITCSTVADGLGNWTCTLPSDLEPGTHTVNVVVTNLDSSTTTLGPYLVQVSGPGTVIDNNTPLAPNAGVGRREQPTVSLLAVLVVAGGLVAVVCNYLVRKYRTKV